MRWEVISKVVRVSGVFSTCSELTFLKDLVQRDDGRFGVTHRLGSGTEIFGKKGPGGEGRKRSKD